MAKLQADFREVKRLYFPRWDRADRWRIRCDGRLRGCGLCDTKKLLVTVQVVHADRTQLLLLLIHEIAHAAANCGHGKTWQRRMLVAADRADALGERALAAALREEVAGYVSAAECGSGTAAHAYGTIADAVADCSAAVPFAGLIGNIARDFGMSGRAFVKAYPRARKVYDKAMRDKADYDATRQRLREARAAHA